MLAGMSFSKGDLKPNIMMEMLKEAIPAPISEKEALTALFEHGVFEPKEFSDLEISVSVSKGEPPENPLRESQKERKAKMLKKMIKKITTTSMSDDDIDDEEDDSQNGSQVRVRKI